MGKALSRSGQNTAMAIHTNLVLIFCEHTEAEEKTMTAFDAGRYPERF
jgi:hypothetical protein